MKTLTQQSKHYSVSFINKRILGLKHLLKGESLAMILVLFLTLPYESEAQENCVLKKDKNNIKVYSCKSKSSDFNAVRAEFELNTSIDKYTSVVLDVDNYKNWHYRAINPRLLNRISESELIYYTQIGAPWPVSNRDLILKLKLEKDTLTNILTVILESIPDYIPMVENVIRVPESYSEMTLKPIEEKKLEVKYFIEVNPGGQLPAWLTNLVCTQGPFETFNNLIYILDSKNEFEIENSGISSEQP